MTKNVKNDISDIIVNTDVMADVLSFTRQRVNQLAKDGILDKRAPGRFLLMQSVKKYIDFVRAGPQTEDEEANAKYWEEKTLHERAKREMAELKLGQIRNRLHDARDVEFVMTNIMATFRNRILGIPQKLAPAVIGITNLAELSELINSELLDALKELSEYSPDIFAGGDIDDENDETV